MNSFFSKFFGKKKKTPEQEETPEQNPISEMEPDERFVHLFKQKGGKFLYCENHREVLEYLQKILEENIWESVYCTHDELKKDLRSIDVPITNDAPVFYTKCENLIVDDGSILFSSNQLGEKRLNTYPENFIVFAHTHQFAMSKDEGLSLIKFRFKDKIPSNISAVTDYMPHKEDAHFLNYGKMNSKNLYLILLEDL